MAEGFLWYFVFLFSVVLHEFSHSYAAMKLGDNTAFDGGQVTLNPIPHIRREIFGTIVVPIFSFLVSGWMIGWASAPYDRDWARRYPDRSGMMAFAGPLANLALVLISAALIHLGMAFDLFYPPDRINFSHITAATTPGMLSTLATLLSIFFSLNLILFFFNLLPIPPLDGSGIVTLFLEERKAVRYMDFMHNAPFMFIGIFLAWEVFDHIYDPIHLVCINMLYPGVSYF